LRDFVTNRKHFSHCMMSPFPWPFAFYGLTLEQAHKSSGKAPMIGDNGKFERQTEWDSNLGLGSDTKLKYNKLGLS